MKDPRGIGIPPEDRRPASRYTSGMLSHRLPTELQRLQVMERMLDPAELTALDRLGIAPSWHCLDLGAGAGSIARWLAERCPQGRVVATDLVTGFLDPSWAPNLDVVVHDVEQHDFPPDSFDLIHARALFMHLSSPDAVMRKVARWLRPGGWLMVSEADMFPVDSTPYPVMARLWTATERLFRAQGADPRWGRALPARLQRTGLVDVDMSISVDILGGGGVNDEFWESSFAQLEPFLIEQGLLGEADFAEARALVRRPGFRDTLWAYVRAWGRRPAA